MSQLLFKFTLFRDRERAEAEKSEAQSHAKTLYAEAERLTGGGPNRLNRVSCFLALVSVELGCKMNFMFERVLQECSELPEELAEIEAKIHECQARLECCGSTDPKVSFPTDWRFV